MTDNAVRVATEPAARDDASRVAPSSPNRARLDRWCERGILVLVLAILIYSPLATGAFRSQDFVVVQWLTVGVIALWLCRFWVNPEHRLLWPPVCWAVVPFMAYAVARYLTAEIEYTARLEVIKVLTYGFLFLAILHNLNKPSFAQFLGLTLIVLATGIALYGIAQFLTGSDRVWHFIRPVAYHKRGSGTFINPNHFAGYLEMLLPLAIVFTVKGRFSHLAKVLLGYATLVIFAGLMVSVSRGAWIATGAALVVLFIWLMASREYRWRGALVLFVLAGIAGAFVLRAELSGNRRDSLSELMAGENLRFQIWEPAIRIWRDHFWTGAGPGHFDYRFRQYRPVGIYRDRMQMRPDRVHNDYLNTLADWGLLGALLVAAAWAAFYWSVIRGWRQVQQAQSDLPAQRPNQAPFVMGAVLGLVAILVHSFADYNMHVPANAILAVTLMALVSTHFRHGSEHYWHAVRGPLRAVITVVLVVSAGWLGMESWKRSLERFWLSRAESHPYYSVEQIAALERAFAIEPRNSDTAYQIGEGYRMHSWQGGEDYVELAEKAMAWLQRSIDLNAYDPYPHLRFGMCLHWLKKHETAKASFRRALDLDPHGYYTLAMMGWHCYQLEEWQRAHDWFHRSLWFFWYDNPIARTYLELLKEKLPENPSAQAGA
jgi:O-antigen ligase